MTKAERGTREVFGIFRVLRLNSVMQLNYELIALETLSKQYFSIKYLISKFPGDGQTLGKLHFDLYENALAVVKGAKEIILFDPRNNHQLYETYIQEATFQVTKNHDSFELVRRGLQERNCFKNKREEG